MATALILFVGKALQKIADLYCNMLILTESNRLPGLLSLIDFVLVASLLVMVLLSGYETLLLAAAAGALAQAQEADGDRARIALSPEAARQRRLARPLGEHGVKEGSRPFSRWAPAGVQRPVLSRDQYCS